MTCKEVKLESRWGLSTSQGNALDHTTYPGLSLHLGAYPRDTGPRGRNPLGSEQASSVGPCRKASSAPGVEAQHLGVVWVEGVMQIDDGGYASFQSCILYICSWQRQRPDCTGAAEQTRTHSLQGKTHPDRRPERGGPSVHMTTFRPGPSPRMDAWSCHCHTGPWGSPTTHGSLGAHSDQRLSWSVHMRSIPPRAPLLNAPPHPQPTLPPESILHTPMP